MKNGFMKRAVAATVCLMLMVSVGACSKKDEGNKAPVANNQVESLVIPITKDEASLTPYTYLTGTPGLEVLRLMYDGLYTTDKDNKVIPWMAKSCENDADYKTFTIKLNEGQKWHDGQPVTLEDVKFTFEYSANQASKRWSKISNRIESMSIENDALIIKTKESQPNFLGESLADQPIVPKHIYEGQADAKQVTSTIGSGIYKLKEYVPDQKYVLEAVDGYFKGDAKVKTLNMPIITDKSSIYQGIQSGQYATFTDRLTPELMKTFEGKADLKVHSGPGFGSAMLYMNNEVKPFDNQEFRQAISLAINSQEIIDRVFLGKATPGTAGYYSPASPYVKGGLNFTYDVNGANAKLDALGYNSKNEQGIRLDSEGKELSFELLSSTDPLRLRAAEIIAQQLLAVGIKATVKSYEPDTLDTYVWPDFDVTKPRNYQMTVWGWSAPGQTKEITPIASCSSNTSIGTENIGGYQNDEFTALEKEYLGTLDPEKRLELNHKMQEVIAKTVPFYTYAYQDQITVYNQKQYDGYVFQNGVGIINVFSFLNLK